MLRQGFNNTSPSLIRIRLERFPLLLRTMTPPGFNIANLGRLRHGTPSISIQIDGSWEANTRYGGAAWVVYDHQQVIHRQGLFLDASSALQTEAVACLQATRWASSTSFSNILTNTDSALLVNFLKPLRTSDITIDHTLNEIRRGASAFTWFQVRKVSRDHIQQAHTLCRSLCLECVCGNASKYLEV